MQMTLLVAHQWPPNHASPMNFAHTSFMNDFSGIVNNGLWEKESGILACQVLCGNFLLWSCCLTVVLCLECHPLWRHCLWMSQVCKADGSLGDLQRFHYITFREFWENSHINISTLYKVLMICVLRRQARKRKEKPNFRTYDYPTKCHSLSSKSESHRLWFHEDIDNVCKYAIEGWATKSPCFFFRQNMCVCVFKISPRFGPFSKLLSFLLIICVLAC